VRVFFPRLAVVGVVNGVGGGGSGEGGGGCSRRRRGVIASHSRWRYTPGRFSFLPMNDRGSSSLGGSVGGRGLRRHVVEHLPVQVKLVIFAVLVLCIVVVSSGAGR
jgi:hypothetical protein